MQLVSLITTPRQGIDFMAILDVVEAIEKSPSQAKRRVSSFRQQKALQGLFKAHFFDSAFMVKNIQAELNRNDGERRKTLLKKYGLNEGEMPSPEQVGRLASDIVSGSLDERAEREKGLTGEWIVMDQVDGRYRYLCLATHDLARQHPEVLVEEAEKGRMSMQDFKKMYNWALKQYQAKES